MTCDFQPKFYDVSTITVSAELIDGLVASHGTAMQPLKQAYGRASMGNMDLDGDRLVNLAHFIITRKAETKPGVGTFQE